MPSYTKEDLKGKALSVQGPINPEDLGKTICHEHLQIDFRVVLHDPPNPDDRRFKSEKLSLSNLGFIKTFWTANEDNLIIDDIEISKKELFDFIKVGGGTIVDVTSIGLNRQPEKLKYLSESTKTNIIMGGGFYVDKSHPKNFKNKTAEEISIEISKDILNGVDSSGIHSGIIGEVGCSFPLTPNERKSLMASILAQKNTGAPILIHPGRDESAPLEIINFIIENGGDISHTVMGHIERTIYTKKMLNLVAETGIFMNFDLFGHESSYYPLAPSSYMPSDQQRIETIKHLLNDGFGDQLLLGHDICSKHRLKDYGGHGWEHIIRNILPRMKENGINDNHIDDMIINNPKKMLTFF